MLFQVWKPNVPESYREKETVMLDDSANRTMSNPNLFLILTFCNICVWQLLYLFHPLV